MTDYKVSSLDHWTLPSVVVSSNPAHHNMWNSPRTLSYLHRVASVTERLISVTFNQLTLIFVVVGSNPTYDNMSDVLSDLS